MSHHTCTNCHQPIAAGEAVLRSVAFELVARHKVCPPQIPTQRRPLSERLAAVR